MGQRTQLVDDVQFAVSVSRPVNSGAAQRHFEPQHGVVPEGLAHVNQMFAMHVDGHLAPVDDDLLDSGTEAVAQSRREVIGELVEVAAIGPL